MGLTAHELLTRMSWRELQERMILEGVRAEEHSPEDLRMARVCLELHHTGFRRFRSPKLDDFLPRRLERPRLDNASQRARVMAWAQSETPGNPVST